MPKLFSLAEAFMTLQGEGVHAGRAAFFIRFASCNLWSGHAEHRERDSLRTGAQCPRFCDTDFKPRVKISQEDLLKMVSSYSNLPIVVFTGGEPLLQLTPELVGAMLERVGQVSVETNGTQALDDGFQPYITEGKLWITCSPKLPANELTLDPRDVSELKVVYPVYNPLSYESWISRAKLPPGRLFVQPEAVPDLLTIGRSSLDYDCMQSAADFCMQNPQWRISLQSHKIMSLP